MKFFDKALPEWILGIIVAVFGFSFVFFGQYSSLSTKVEANTERLKQTVTQDEFKAIISGQKDMNKIMEKRFDRLEDKIDHLKVGN